MTIARRLAFGLALLSSIGIAFHSTPARARQERKSHAEMVLSAIDIHFIPRVSALHRASKALAQDVEALCGEPDNADLRARTEASFAESVVALGAIDFVRFGPSADAHRLERFFFWPDPRAVTDRQLAGALARRDETVLNTSAFAAQSAAIQGLGALEAILYDGKRAYAQPGPEGQYRCAFASAAAANLESIAGEIETGWTSAHGWREKMLGSGSDNPLYKDAAEAARDAVKALMTGLQIAQDRHVMPRLEAALAEPPRRARLPFARSGLSGRYFEAEISSLADLFDALGLIAYVPPQKAWMGTFVQRAFKALDRDAAALPAVDGTAAKDAGTIALLRKMRFDINGVRQIIHRELAPAADLALGFNELDGD